MGQLAQAAVTVSAASILTPSTGQELIVTGIRVVNYSASNRWIELYHDENGTTYDSTSMILPRITVPANSVYTLTKDEGGPIILGDTGGNLAIKGEANSALTVTVYGVTRT